MGLIPFINANDSSYGNNIGGLSGNNTVASSQPIKGTLPGILGQIVPFNGTLPGILGASANVNTTNSSPNTQAITSGEGVAAAPQYTGTIPVMGKYRGALPSQADTIRKTLLGQ